MYIYIYLAQDFISKQIVRKVQDAKVLGVACLHADLACGRCIVFGSSQVLHLQTIVAFIPGTQNAECCN